MRCISAARIFGLIPSLVSQYDSIQSHKYRKYLGSNLHCISTDQIFGLIPSVPVVSQFAQTFAQIYSQIFAALLCALQFSCPDIWTYQYDSIANFISSAFQFKLQEYSTTNLCLNSLIHTKNLLIKLSCVSGLVGTFDR